MSGRPDVEGIKRDAWKWDDITSLRVLALAEYVETLEQELDRVKETLAETRGWIRHLGLPVVPGNDP